MKPDTIKQNLSPWQVDTAVHVGSLALKVGSSGVSDLMERYGWSIVVPTKGADPHPTVTVSRTPRAPEAQLVEDQIRNAFALVYAADPVVHHEPADAVAKWTEKLREIGERLSRVENLLKDALKEVASLRARERAIWVPIETVAPEPYELSRPITAVITSAGEEFEACFFDANLYGSGDTEEEAISDLKSVIVETFERLSALPDEKLGPAMIKQKLVLGVYMHSRGKQER